MYGQCQTYGNRPIRGFFKKLFSKKYVNYGIPFNYNHEEEEWCHTFRCGGNYHLFFPKGKASKEAFSSGFKLTKKTKPTNKPTTGDENSPVFSYSKWLKDDQKQTLDFFKILKMKTHEVKSGKKKIQKKRLLKRLRMKIRNDKNEFLVLMNIVRDLMRQDERCRNDDKWLTYRTMRKFTDIKIPFEDFSKIPSFESISRCRRKIQKKVQTKLDDFAD